MNLHRKYRDKGFEILSLAVMGMDEASMKKFLGPLKPEFPIVETTDDVGKLYGIEFIPVNVVVGPDGRILKRLEGAHSEEDLEAAIGPLIAKRS